MRSCLSLPETDESVDRAVVMLMGSVSGLGSSDVVVVSWKMSGKLSRMGKRRGDV